VVGKSKVRRHSGFIIILRIAERNNILTDHVLKHVTVEPSYRLLYRNRLVVLENRNRLVS
jgi:hypothetical protein